MGGIGDREEKSFAELPSIPNHFICNWEHLRIKSLETVSRENPKPDDETRDATNVGIGT